MISVLINAYACAPNIGSEPGMAWNWIINLGKYCKLHVITEGEWQIEIEEALHKLPQGKNINFYYNPVSEKVRKMCWNQGDWRFYYYYKKWQVEVFNIAKDIIHKEHIDLIHQLNMIGFREPGYLWKINETPLVWGPIGGVKNIPENYLKKASLKVKLFFKLKNKINTFQIRKDKRVIGALRRADLLISSIPETQKAIQEYHSLDSVLIPETGCYLNERTIPKTISDKNSFDILWVGKFDFRKQLGLALRTISKLKNLKFIKFHVVGSGKEKEIKYFKLLTRELNIETNVIWHGTISQKQVFNLMSNSQLFFFTSISEDTSTVVMEALSENLPVLCFDACGFGPVVNSSVGEKINFSNPKQSIKEFSEKIDRLYSNRNKLSILSRNCAARQLELSWDRKAQKMIEIYKSVIHNSKSKIFIEEFK